MYVCFHDDISRVMKVLLNQIPSFLYYLKEDWKNTETDQLT